MNKLNFPLIFFVSFELCYYLLIAQTGIVEFFGSDLTVIAYMPLGGITGSILSVYINYDIKKKILFLTFVQFCVTFFYPGFNSLLLFILGLSVGGMAPLIIYSLKKAAPNDFIVILSISYLVGTSLFNTPVQERAVLGIIFSLIVLLSVFKTGEKKYPQEEGQLSYPVFMMMLWVFLDSALFESLSRDIQIPIWRGGYSFEIILFHITGVVFAVKLQLGHKLKEMMVILLFALSYLFYFLREPLLLSIVYPFVISYYNTIILQEITKIKDIKKIGLIMVFIGWGASGAGLYFALEDLMIYIPAIFLIFIIISELFITKKINSQQGVYYV
jgi:hypothetical protein